MLYTRVLWEINMPLFLDVCGAGVIIFVDTDECQLNSYSIAPIVYIKCNYYLHGQYFII